MSSAREQRAALVLLTGRATATSAEMVRGSAGSPAERRLALLNDIPELISYYAEGSAALALDFYEEERDAAGVTSRFSGELVIPDRTVKIRRGTAWAAEPLFSDDEETAILRLASVVQLETARPYRDTILGNQADDSAAIGWKRITAGGCKMCRMLADRGAVYKESTARFATHDHCHCTAAPVFRNGDVGPEASAIQYSASRRNQTPAAKERLKTFLNDYY